MIHTTGVIHVPATHLNARSNVDVVIVTNLDIVVGGEIRLRHVHLWRIIVASTGLRGRIAGYVRGLTATMMSRWIAMLSRRRVAGMSSVILLTIITMATTSQNG